MDFIPFHQSFQTGTPLEQIFKDIDPLHMQGGGPASQLVLKFLDEKYNFQHSFLTPSCTAALEMAALILDIQPEDEIIVPSYTFVTSASSFALRGAKIKFVDVDPTTLCLDIAQIEKSISPKTKAIIYVHYGGSSGAIDHLKEICTSKNIFLVEDAAQALGAKYKDRWLGSYGDMSTFSFHSTKNIHCGEGGLLVVNNENLLERAHIVHEKGTNRRDFQTGVSSFYEWKELGSSFLMGELPAAFLLDQLNTYDQNLSTRRVIFKNYLDELNSLCTEKNIWWPKCDSHSLGSAHNFYLVFEKPEDSKNIITKYKSKGIDVRRHYKALHLTSYGKKYGEFTLPCSEKADESLIRLPLYPEIEKHQKVIIDATIELLNEI